MSRPDTSIIASEIQSIRDGIKAQFEQLCATAKAEATASYSDAQIKGQAAFHPFHTCLG